MIKPMLLKLHRWTGLVFALPLLAILVTGLILSFEPMSQMNGMSRPVDAARVMDLLQRYDPEGKARGLFINAAAQRLRLRDAPTPAIDLVTGEPATTNSVLANVFLWARFTHERLLGLPWLVTASTIAMLLIMSLGIAIGLPRLRNSLSGWHKGAAWFSLPLILLTPLTGLCMAFGLTFQSAPAPAGATRPNIRVKTLVEAVNVVARSHDLSHVISIDARGGRMRARIYEGGELRAYAVNADGLTALPRNWPRLIHEGNWAAMIGSPANILVAVVLLGLLTTGVWLWGRRTLARRQRQDRDRAVQVRSAAWKTLIWSKARSPDPAFDGRDQTARKTCS